LTRKTRKEDIVYLLFFTKLLKKWILPSVQTSKLFGIHLFVRNG